MRTHTLALVACSLALLAGCANRRPLSIPAGAETPEQIASQIDRASKLVRDAQHAELSGRPKDAKAKYQEAISIYRELPVAWNNLGKLYMEEGSNLAAADAFKTSSELSPTDPRPLHNLGALWESLGYLDDASRWYSDALLRDDHYLPSLRRTVIVEEIRNKPDATTLDRIRRALLLETDPWWIERFKRARLRFENLIAARQADAMTREGLTPGAASAPTMPAPAASAFPADRVPPPAPTAVPAPAPAPAPTAIPAGEPTPRSGG